MKFISAKNILRVPLKIGFFTVVIPRLDRGMMGKKVSPAEKKWIFRGTLKSFYFQVWSYL